MAAAFIAVAGAPFAASSARAESGAANAAADKTVAEAPMPTPVATLAHADDSAKTDSTKTEAAKTETAKIDDAKAEPRKTDGAKADATKADATKADATKADATKADATKADAAKADAAKTDSTKTQDGAAAAPAAPQQDSAHSQDAAPGKDAAAAPAQDVKQDTKQETKPDTKPDSSKDASGNAPAQAQTDTQASASCPGNPNALGTSRVLAIDPAEYKRLGRMQYPDSLPLQDKEVVITFDDGPLPPYSNQILDILASECVKVTYFLVGEMARAYPAVVRREYEAGHTIGTHSEDHPLHFGELPPARMRAEIDVGISDVAAALGDTKYLAPFFRIPGLDRSNTLEDELAARHLIVFSSDTVADDWRRISPEQIRTLALKRLEARGKGILLLHDIHAKTVAALPGILKDLKDNGFRVVQVVPSASYEIAMANKPKAQVLASALPGELSLPNGIDGAAAKPAWPQPAAENSSSEVTALPAPDPSEFQPDSGVADDTANVQWPEPPPKLAASSEEEGHHAARSSEHRHHKKHDADSDEHDRHHHRHEHERAGNGRHHADLVTGIKSLAALFTPTQTRN